MLFQTGHSGLVLLSDCLKVGVLNALQTTGEIISLHKKHAVALKGIREIARKYLQNDQVEGDAQEELKAAGAGIPAEDARGAIALQRKLHIETLSVVLNSCFALESYINSLGFFVLRERDVIGLVKNSTASAADAFMLAVDKMSTLTKWQMVGNLKSESGLDPAAPPFQDLKTLFRFRDDHVHDKVVDWGSDRGKKRYNNKLPESFGGFLLLSHAIFACDTYWGMILKIHDLVGIPASDFHKHYNLKPWFDGEFERHARQTAKDYEQACLAR